MLITQDSKALYQALREWFDSVCNCDGFNNLYKHDLSCVDDTIGIVNVTSEVHSDEDKTAQMLIDLAKTDIERRTPAEVEISSNWILCLNKDCRKNDSSNVGESGMLPNTMQQFTLYIKNISCKNVRKSV